MPPGVVPTQSTGRRGAVSPADSAGFLGTKQTGQESGMDGDLLLEADDTVLKELGVKSAVDRKKIKTKYKTFVKGQH